MSAAWRCKKYKECSVLVGFLFRCLKYDHGTASLLVKIVFTHSFAIISGYFPHRTDTVWVVFSTHLKLLAGHLIPRVKLYWTPIQNIPDATRLIFDSPVRAMALSVEFSTSDAPGTTYILQISCVPHHESLSLHVSHRYQTRYVLRCGVDRSER